MSGMVLLVSSQYDMMELTLHLYSIPILFLSVCEKKSSRQTHSSSGKVMESIMNTHSSGISVSRVIYSSVDMSISRDRLESEISSYFLILVLIIRTSMRQRVSLIRRSLVISREKIYFILIIFRYICDYLPLTDESNLNENDISEQVFNIDSNYYEKKSSRS